MKIVIFKELKVFKFSELKEKLGTFVEVKANETVEILLKCKLLKKTDDYSKEQLENLLLDENFELNKEFGRENTYFFKYVGMISLFDTCFIIYPKYIADEDIERDKASYSILKQILAVIRKYNADEQEQFISKEEINKNFSLLALTLELIEDYYNNGLYFNEKSIIEENGIGEIVWNKTINESIAYFRNDTPIYLNLFSKFSTLNEKDFFRRLHASILSTCSSLLKEILKIIDIEELSLSYEQVEDFGSEEYIMYRLNQEISQQYISKKQKTLNLLKTYIERKDSYYKDDEISFVGTTSFNLVWEKVCKVILDKNNNTSKLKEKVYRPIWSLKNKEYSSKETLEPDILVLEKNTNNLHIYDAKYYNIDKNKPGISDITKQFLYSEVFNKLGYNILSNTFLFPTHRYSSEDIDIGHIRFELFNSKIKLILKSAPKLYEEYLKY